MTSSLIVPDPGEHHDEGMLRENLWRRPQWPVSKTLRCHPGQPRRREVAKADAAPLHRRRAPRSRASTSSLKDNADGATVPGPTGQEQRGTVGASASPPGEQLAAGPGPARRPVVYVDQDGLATVNARPPGFVPDAPRNGGDRSDGDGVSGQTNQPNPPWGLDRVDQKLRPLNNLYRYSSRGTGVTAYIIDTGILTTHADFGGRAVGGFTAINDGRGSNDCHGHGTHVAGTTGGATYGVAKNVRLVAVRVLDCGGSGAWSASSPAWTGDEQPHRRLGREMSPVGLRAGVNDAFSASIAQGVSYAIAAATATTTPATTPRRPPRARSRWRRPTATTPWRASRTGGRVSTCTRRREHHLGLDHFEHRDGGPVGYVDGVPARGRSRGALPPGQPLRHPGDGEQRHHRQRGGGVVTGPGRLAEHVARKWNGSVSGTGASYDPDVTYWYQNNGGHPGRLQGIGGRPGPYLQRWNGSVWVTVAGSDSVTPVSGSCTTRRRRRNTAPGVRVLRRRHLRRLDDQTFLTPRSVAAPVPLSGRGRPSAPPSRLYLREAVARAEGGPWESTRSSPRRRRAGRAPARHRVPHVRRLAPGAGLTQAALAKVFVAWERIQRRTTSTRTRQVLLRELLTERRRRRASERRWTTPGGGRPPDRPRCG